MKGTPAAKVGSLMGVYAKLFLLAHLRKVCQGGFTGQYPRWFITLLSVALQEPPLIIITP